MGILRHFFSCKDIELRAKYWVYVAGPLSILLWGSESWNLSVQNRVKLRAFHHSEICRILGIWMDEVIARQITNEQVRNWFGNIPPINKFIMRRTWIYIGKVYRVKEESLPKKNVRSLDSSISKTRETTYVLQRQLHPLSQVSPQRPNQQRCHIQRMVPNSSKQNTLELVD